MSARNKWQPFTLSVATGNGEGFIQTVKTKARLKAKVSQLLASDEGLESITIKRGNLLPKL
jgi:hypothetical protein